MGTVKQMGTLGPMDIGASGPWGEMGTRKNEHQSKWTLDNWENEQFVQMGVWDKWAFGEMGILGQIGTWGMATRKNEHQSKWAFGANGHFWGQWVCGTNGH